MYLQADMDYIQARKKELNAIILSHYYQLPEIQEAADLVADSLLLAQEAARTEAEVIVLCGVDFMAESAKIISPDKTVLLPEKQAGCPMAQMVDAQGLSKLKQEYPEAVVVTYINSSAEIKALSDICCTSSNAVRVVASIPADKEIIFVPDKNLGAYIETQTGRKMILWEGCCPVHDQLNENHIITLKKQYPEAVVVVHPECTPAVIAQADEVSSTAGILAYIKASSAQEFIVGTEAGFLYTLQKHCPDKTFYLGYEPFRCEDMKKITIPILAATLKDLNFKMEVAENIRIKARTALDRMLALA